MIIPLKLFFYFDPFFLQMGHLLLWCKLCQWKLVGNGQLIENLCKCQNQKVSRIWHFWGQLWDYECGYPHLRLHTSQRVPLMWPGEYVDKSKREEIFFILIFSLKPYIAGWLWYKCMRRNRGLVNPIWPRGGADLPTLFLIKEKHLFFSSKNSYISRIKPLRYLNWVKMAPILGEPNFRPFFEQVTSSRSSGESLGADLPPPLPTLGLKRSNKGWVL